MEEVWKPIINYETYEVSNLGNVKSLNYNKTKKEKLLIPTKFNNGYYYVWLSNKKSGSKKIAVHRLVANAFIENTDNKREVNHIDGIKTNNCVDNLEWVTSSENHLHAFKKGLMPQLYQDGHKRWRWN